MRKPPPDDVVAMARYNRYRADISANYRSRKDRGAKLVSMEVTALNIALAIKFDCLRREQVDDDNAFAAGISKFYALCVTAFLNQKKVTG